MVAQVAEVLGIPESYVIHGEHNATTVYPVSPHNARKPTSDNRQIVKTKPEPGKSVSCVYQRQVVDSTA